MLTDLGLCMLCWQGLGVSAQLPARGPVSGMLLAMHMLIVFCTVYIVFDLISLRSMLQILAQ